MQWLNSCLLKLIIQWIVKNSLLNIFMMSVTSSMLNNITLHNIYYFHCPNTSSCVQTFYVIIFIQQCSFSVLVSLLVFEIYNGPKYASAEAATWEVFWKIGVLKFAVKILEKYLRRSLFLLKLQSGNLQLSVGFPEVFT